jgi:hypothetical protein
MLEKNILDTQDIKMLWNKINVRYLWWCKATKGSYTISREFADTTLMDVKIKDLTINVNLCPSYEYLHNLSTYVEEIFSHELGHHVYYFKDSNPKNFENICRTKKWANICDKWDFVSSYAESKAEEDYAESFLFRYKKNPIDTSYQALQSKINYFSKLF